MLAAEHMTLLPRAPKRTMGTKGAKPAQPKTPSLAGTTPDLQTEYGLQQVGPAHTYNMHAFPRGFPRTFDNKAGWLMDHLMKDYPGHSAEEMAAIVGNLGHESAAFT